MHNLYSVYVCAQKQFMRKCIRIAKLETRTDKHEEAISAYEIIVSGIPGERIPEIKVNFSRLMKHLHLQLKMIWQMCDT